jgi:hypothetical protein
VGGWEVEILEVETNMNGVINGICLWTIPMFKNSGTKSRMINVMINEDYQMMNGRIKTIYNPDSPFVYDGRKDRTETAETTTTTESASSATTTANASTEITIENEIDSVFINDDGKIVVLDTAGNETTYEIPKDENGESKPVTITDGAGKSYTVEGGEVKESGEYVPDTDEPADSTDTDSTTVERIQYSWPLTVHLDDDYYLTNTDMKEFSDGDTITIESYMLGVTLLLKDAEGQSVELLPSHFPDNAGEIWPPGFTVDIEGLEEGEIEEVKILIPEQDTMYVVIEKYEPALVMSPSDILALLSDINEAQKDDNTTCDLSARLVNYSTGDISGDLGKVKVNEKYEVQSLKLKLTHQSNTEISLEDVDIVIKEGADKDKEIAVFTFKDTGDDESMLELTVEKKDREFLEWYLLGVKPLFKITTTHVTHDDYATVSSFNINRGTFSGYFLERSEGTTAQERTAGSYKRIPEGDYEMCYTYKQCRSATTRSNADNESWIKTYGETDNTGATITREYVLIHTGNYPWNSAGCLLIGSSYSDNTLDEEIKEDETGITYEKDLVVKKVSSSGDKLTALNNEYKKLIDLAKKFDDDCENSKCYELEIDINR